MATQYAMPKLAMAMNEGSINEWLVKTGDKVESGQPLLTVETEKVAYDCESPQAGYISIKVAAGETVPCDSLIAWFCDSAEEAMQMADENAPDAPSPTSEIVATATEIPVATATSFGQDGGRIIASPLAKKLAADKLLDLRQIRGSGPGGRIVKRDILQAPSQTLAHSGHMVQSNNRILARIPMTGLRKGIADRMMQSLQTTAQLSSAWESDITDLLAMRIKLVEKAEQLGSRVSVNAFIIKAICYAIRQVPIANACREGEEIVIYDNINIGIAIALPGSTEYDSSLRVAVLRNVETMGLVQIDQQMKALIDRVRSGKGSSDDLSGSTITLSSTAGLAPPGLTTTPVLNLPNVALIGPSTPIERPMYKNGQLQPRTMLPLSFTFDHCALDGEPAAKAMFALHQALENPELLLA